MPTEYITVKTYCVHYNVTPDFILLLDEAGLIEIPEVDGEPSIALDYFPKLERYINLHYDLRINIEGIDVVTNLLDRVSTLQNEINSLKSRLKLYE
ncbi:chaperone modulator CbpM [Flavobacterium kingsejongi]|uniref:MerR family transcriptional regulator n=1 Tax=Flavobacterium kingsejongi TaxID=1678728 RepID=A0A2S1LRG5_9FLAO|nr:chaperone modulator CbpM [Flavobacterium kingsejongi]AWG26355.1 hypothetical protein FK004_14515 [Flavobacterium kingsejongi]